MTRVIFVLSLLGAVVPPLIYLVGVRWLGRLEREPLHILLLVLSWGAIGGTVGGLVGSSVIGDTLGVVFDPRLMMDFVEFAVYVPAGEEIAKGIVLVALASTSRLSHTTSGLIYGFAVGLGFAITENIIYSLHVFQVSGISDWYSNMVVRTVFSSTVHGICSAMFGYCLGWAKTRIPGEPRYIFGSMVGLSMAFSLHGGWNALMFLGDEMGDPLFTITAFVSTPFLVLTLLAVTYHSLRAEGKILRLELTAESLEGVIPAEHIPVLCATLHPLKRAPGWLKEGVEEARYVELACLLALRRNAQAPAEELELLRGQIKGVLEVGGA